MARKKPKLSIAEKAVMRLDLPGEAAGTLSVITMTGNRRIHIDSHRGIVDYSENRICVNCGKMILQINGSSLELAGMTDSEILIKGIIDSVEFHL